MLNSLVIWFIALPISAFWIRVIPIWVCTDIYIYRCWTRGIKGCFKTRPLRRWLHQSSCETGANHISHYPHNSCVFEFLTKGKGNRPLNIWNYFRFPQHRWLLTMKVDQIGSDCMIMIMGKLHFTSDQSEGVHPLRDKWIISRIRFTNRIPVSCLKIQFDLYACIL